MNNPVYRRLLPVVRRIRFRRVMVTLALIWFWIALTTASLIYFNHAGRLDVAHYGLPVALIAFVFSLLGIGWAFKSRRDMKAVVLGLERRFPDLDSSLLTAVEQHVESEQSLGFLQADVLQRTVNHSYSNHWTALVPSWQLIAAPFASTLAFVLLVGAIVSMVIFAKPIAIGSGQLFSDVVIERGDFEIAIEPGNAEVERETSLLVLARFPKAIPPDSVLNYKMSDGEPIRVAMNKSLDDPVFGARIASISEPFEYWIEYAQRRSGMFRISVFDYPSLVRADAKLQFPNYTKLADKVLQDVRRISAVEGTEVEFSFYVNKEIADATLVPVGKQDNRTQTTGFPELENATDSLPSLDSPSLKPIALRHDPTDPQKFGVRMTMIQSTRFELKLVDHEGRENRIPPQLILNVLENQVPDLKLASPRRDVQVSAIEELKLAATAWDDFGVNALGLNFSIAGKVANERVLLTDGAARQQHEIDHLLEFESLQAAPDELLSYYFWAEDLGPDGQPRRVQSDMFFAEVRHFDEIFRQGQSPSAGEPSGEQAGQSGQSVQAAQQLAELQKEIINATWNLIRRETKRVVSDDFAADLQLLTDSQGDAIQQLEELASQIDDSDSRSYVDAATTHMKEAVVHLSEAQAESSAENLQPALSSEQSAYQAMLKLRAREHEVVRAQQQQQSGQQGQQAGNRAQQQLEQLNLKDDENRYENERTAAEQQPNTEQREDRQVLSRLRELARRQEDLNDRIKELQSALDKSATPAEKEEIERRLKSLRDQQEQMLRDTDELLDRMQQSENQKRMTDEAEQLERTRENLREASESLEKGEVSRAAADGERAQRELEELRDDFQNRAASQFNDQMRDLRNEAQELENREEQIGNDLANENRNRKTDRQVSSLRNEENASDIVEQLKKQQESVDRLRNRMQETIEDAESIEPLLAEQLYDTYRQSEQSRPDRDLESARQSLERGWTEDAQAQETSARAGISEMREGIEQAAESVLGDETEALRAAQETLRKLNEQLQQEMDRARVSNDGSRGNSRNQNQGNQTEEPSSTEPPNQTAAEQNSNSQPSVESSNEQSRGQGNRQAEANEERQSRESQKDASQSDSQQPSESQTDGQQGGGQQESESPGGQPGGQRDGEGQGNDGQPNPRAAGQGGTGAPDGMDDRRSGLRLQNGGGNQRTIAPISGADFREWSDRLRDVEEMMPDSDMRSEAARVRDEAKQIRREASRHSAEPNWDLVKMKIAKPLAELQDRVTEELLRRTSRNARVPLDRDPVPTKYQESVRRYYERIGSGQ